MGYYQVTFLETSAGTQGAYAFIEINMGPKDGNGLYYHKKPFEILA